MLEEEEVMGLMDIKIGKAEEEEKQEGEILGANNKTVELAKKMLKENISTDVISKVTGLSKKVLMTML